MKSAVVIRKSMTLPNSREMFNLYMQDISKYKVFTKEEEFACFNELRSGNLSMHDKIIRHNLLFVVSVAKQYQGIVMNTALTLEDLITEGNIGLCMSVDKFDHTLGNKFISYAVFQIKAHILICIKSHVKSIHIPGGRQAVLYKLNKLESELEQNISSGVDVQTLTQAAIERGLITDKYDAVSYVSHLKTESKFTTSLSQTLNRFDDSAHELIDILIDENSILPSDKIMKDDIVNNFRTMLNTVPLVHRYMLELYFGIDVEQPLDLKQISQYCELSGYISESTGHSLTGQRIKQIIDQYIRRMRSRFRNSENSFV